MDRVLLAIVRVSVGFSLFFLTLYLIFTVNRPLNDSEDAVLSVGDVLWIGGMFVSVGVVSLVALLVFTLMSRRRSRESAIARLEEPAEGIPTPAE